MLIVSYSDFIYKTTNNERIEQGYCLNYIAANMAF